MTLQPTTAAGLIAPLSMESGGFAMLALDQRESLRRMFPLADGQEVGDDVLRSFKQSAIGALTPFASGVLLDRPYAVTSRRPDGIAPGCGLILAADVLEQPAGHGVISSTLDREVTPEFIRSVAAVAIKLLVIWRADGSESQREALVRDFVSIADEAGVASLVEGIVRPAGNVDFSSHEDRHRAILDAAEELAGYGGSIYKAEVPGYIPGDLRLVREQSELLTERIDAPWVVLSNGVSQPDFADAVREACLGGASGFLAGRAIWADTVPEHDVVGALQQRSTGRLSRLRDIVASALGS